MIIETDLNLILTINFTILSNIYIYIAIYILKMSFFKIIVGVVICYYLYTGNYFEDIQFQNNQIGQSSFIMQKQIRQAQSVQGQHTKSQQPIIHFVDNSTKIDHLLGINSNELLEINSNENQKGEAPTNIGNIEKDQKGQNGQAIKTNKQKQVIKGNAVKNDESFFLFRWIGNIFSIIFWLISLLKYPFKLLWFLITTLWSIITYVWIVFILVLNGFFIFIMLWFSKSNNNRYMQENKNHRFFVFLACFGALIIFPIAFNWLLCRREVALNLLLPIYITLFVEVLNQNSLLAIDSTVPRNLVFFAFLCVFL